jgi:hypothetical protein
MNYLDLWKEAMLLEKWKRADHNSTYFQNVGVIYDVLKTFYGYNEFDFSKGNSGNWIFHIVANRQTYSLILLSEHVELLRYLDTISTDQYKSLRNREGQVNHREINERLFEVYVSYILSKSGLQTFFDQFYIDKLNNTRPIDVLVELNSASYNVEVTKFYDPYKEELLSLGRQFAIRAYQLGQKRQVNIDELFSGYIAFRKKSLQGLKPLVTLFNEKVKEHFHNFKRPENQTIRAVPKISNDDFEFLIEPTYLDRYNDYNNLLKNFYGFMKFRLRCDISTMKVTWDVAAEINSDLSELNEQLIRKIEEKIDQHRTYAGNKLIVVGIESVPSTHKKGSALPIGKNEVDIKRVSALLKQDTLVLIIFKETKVDSILFDRLIVGDKSHHDEIIKYLHKVDFQVRVN